MSTKDSAPIKESAARATPPGRKAVRLLEGKTPKSDRKQESKSTEAPRSGKKSERVKAKILQAALECFGAFGFDGATTRAIADRAGVTHTLVLYHFKSKEELWLSTLNSVLERYGSEMKQILETSGENSAAKSLKIFIEQFVRMSARYPQVHRILTSEGDQDSERLQWVVDHFLRDHFVLVRDLIRRGQSEGSVRDCDPTRLYYFIIGAGGTPFSIASEYKLLTGRNVFSEAEVFQIIAFIYEIVLV